MNKYNEEFLPYVIKWGKRTNMFAAIISFLPITVVVLVYGVRAPIDAVISSIVMSCSVVAVMWISDLIAYSPILGIPGTYMAFLSGNYGNLKVPVATIAQDSVGAEPGSQKGSVISVVAMATSSIECIIFLAATIAIGTGGLSKLPEAITSSLNYLIPALHAALLCRATVGQRKLRFVGIGLAIIGFFVLKMGWLSFLPGNPSYVVVFLSVFGTIFVAKEMAKKDGANTEKNS